MMCCAIRYDNPSIRARSPRRRRTVSAMSWLCAGQRGGTRLSLPHIPTSSTSIVTFITTPPPLTAPGNSETFGAPASPSVGSLTGCALKTGCPLSRKGKYRNYGEWQKERKGPLSYQDRLRLAIDTALAERPADLDEFLNLMKRAGYEVKTVRGGGISFRLTGQGQERFTRLRASTLGDGYDLQDVLSAIEGKEKRPGHSERKISLAVDIQAKLAAGKGPGYERWAKVFNIKQMAAALAYIQDNGLTDYEQLADKVTATTDCFHTLSEQIKQTENAMKANAELKGAIVQYAKARPVFEQYKATKYSRKFLAEHEAEIELYRAAQADMKRLLNGAKLPKMETLKEEGRKLATKKNRLYGEYQKARRDMQELVTIKANIDCLLGYNEPGRKQEKER